MYRNESETGENRLITALCNFFVKFANVRLIIICNVIIVMDLLLLAPYNLVHMYMFYVMLCCDMFTPFLLRRKLQNNIHLTSVGFQLLLLKNN